MRPPAYSKRSLSLTRSDAKSSIFGLRPEAVLSKSFQSAVRRTGIAGFTFHDCRRVYLNRLRQSGVSIETAMALTDHKSLATVLQYYREVPEADLQEAVAGIATVNG